MGEVEAVTGKALWSSIGIDTTFTFNTELNFNTNSKILNTGDLVVGAVTPNGPELPLDVVNPDPALVNVFSDPAFDDSRHIDFSDFRFAENGPVLNPSEYSWHSSIKLGFCNLGRHCDQFLTALVRIQKSGWRLRPLRSHEMNGCIVLIS